MQEEDIPPFWSQTTDTPRRRRHQPRRTGSFYLNSSLLLIILVVILAVLIFIIVPYIVSFTSQIFRPQLVKKSWDSLNLVLVLFAIFCGFLSRNNGGDSANHYPENRVSNEAEDVQRSNLRQWYDHDHYSDRPANGSLNRLRSSSSYPDLRLESPWVSGGDLWRFSDDTQVDNYRVIGSDQVLRRRQHLEAKNVEVNQKEVSSVSYTPPPPSSPPPPPAPPPPKVVRRRPKQASQSVGVGGKRKAENEENNDAEVRTSQPPAPPPPPPPPQSPPLVPLFEEIEQKSGSNDKKRAGATKDFLTSFYNQPKGKKKQRQKSVENLESLFNSEPSSSTLHPPQSAAPPPPPPPPPHSVFHNLFSSKKGKTKTKKIHSVQPPQSQISTVQASKSTSQFDPITTHTQKPLFPVKVSNYSTMDENVNLGNESPLNSIPPPPPPPPFKMPAWRFVVHGDYVRLKSFNSASSRSGSPDIDDAEALSSKESSPMARSAPVMDGGDSKTPLFWPSPDVDTKADSFIARFRAGLKLEKMDSMEEKRGRGRSNLGQEANPRPET